MFYLANRTVTGRTKETFEQMSCFDGAKERRTGGNGGFTQIFDSSLSLKKKKFADNRRHKKTRVLISL